MPKPLPYLFSFFGILAGLVTLVAIAPNLLNWLNYGFVLCTFYLAVVLVPLHLMALVFYLCKYLLSTNKYGSAPE
jgi:hypothetical protein